MKRIESRQNPIYKQWVRSFRQAGRQSHSVWIEGPHLCESWLENEHPVEWLLVDEARKDHPDIVAIIQTLQKRQALDKICILSHALFKGLSEVPSPQGVLIVAPKPRHELPAQFESSVVVLDGVQDPGNVGVILRTCAAAGVSVVITQGDTAACWSPKVLRSAQGAHTGLLIIEGLDVHQWLAQYKQQEKRLPILVTTLEQAGDLYRTKLPERGIWVFGNEGQGVSAQITALADLRVRIPHLTSSVESLNVGVAAALCLFEQLRQMTN